ncbi:MAG TPA: FeoA family protein [Anaerolineales bacterium]
MRLLDVEIGHKVRVVGFEGSGLNSRLLRVGVYPGDEMTVMRRAPIGGPLLVSVGGREMALGRRVAARIRVEEL